MVSRAKLTKNFEAKIKKSNYSSKFFLKNLETFFTSLKAHFTRGHILLINKMINEVKEREKLYE